MFRGFTLLDILIACVPGFGYMYNGLVKKGIEFFGVFLILPKILNFVGLSELNSIILLPLWLYSFIDTLNIIKRKSMGESIPDIGFIVGQRDLQDRNLVSRRVKLVGVAFIFIGILGVINRVFVNINIMYIIKTYVVPVLFIFLGLLLILKSNIGKQ